MKYTSSFFVHPPEMSLKEVQLIQDFLDNELSVPRDSFSQKEALIIFNFVKHHFYKHRVQIYVDGSNEEVGFEIFLSNENRKFEHSVNRVRYFIS
jgi:hypothetical protein